MKDAAFQQYLWYMRNHLLPSSNILPRTMDMVNKLLGMTKSYDLEPQACINSCQVWPFVPRKDWHKHKDDKCSKCKQPR